MPDLLFKTKVVRIDIGDGEHGEFQIESDQPKTLITRDETTTAAAIAKKQMLAGMKVAQVPLELLRKLKVGDEIKISLEMVKPIEEDEVGFRRKSDAD